MPLITTIMCTYNSEKYLVEAIESVLSQTLPTDEFIIVDNCSTDSTIDIINRYPQINVYTQEDKGNFKSMNFAFDKANGKYLTFLDSDDLWHKDKNQLQLEFLEQHQELDMVFCNCCQFLEKSDQSRVYRASQPGVLQWGMLMQRDNFMSIGKFETEYQAAFIKWFHTAMSMGKKHEVLNQDLVYRRIHEQNHSTTMNYTHNLTALAMNLIKSKRNLYSN